ncbi:unnamed protein product [Protopolystoma xenopodis]|uniref:Uncharacterized protein n=1 Tax=Protopolystoma xenopodis TaxID=117903 RepID=A0A448X9Z0_9PLAT|nr:unnamed protein product [Protopolystoma xenopodis]
MAEVSTRRRGRSWLAIHRRYPATAPRGDFCLLGFPPGPVRPSLCGHRESGLDLDPPPSGDRSISAPCLTRTPDQHEPATIRTPHPAGSRHLASKSLDYRRAPPRPAVQITHFFFTKYVYN